MLPTKVELKQAILCDDMPTLSPIQMGPSGRSVARSYANAISKLIPAGPSFQSLTRSNNTYLHLS